MNFLVKMLHYLPIKGSVHVMHILGKLLGVAIVSPVIVLRVNIGAFCLRMRENRSVRLQMADLLGGCEFCHGFTKNMD